MSLVTSNRMEQQTIHEANQTHYIFYKKKGEIQINKGEKLGAEKSNTFLDDIQGGITLCNYNTETMASVILFINRNRQKSRATP